MPEVVSPMMLDIALPGLVMGTDVVKVLSGWDTVTGRDRIGEAPLDKSAVALEMAALGLVTGTFVVIVVSD